VSPYDPPLALGPNAQLAWDVLHMKPTKGIPQWHIFLMGIPEIEHFAGRQAGSYHKDVEGTYLEFQRRIGTCFLDQYIPDNPLSMDASGLAGHERSASAGLEEIVLDGIRIDSPEAVVEHMERFALPRFRQSIDSFDLDDPEPVLRLIRQERETQRKFGPDILKVPHGGFISQPYFRYGDYGYVNYFTAYALYPELMERDFSLQADFAFKLHTVAARAIKQGNLPPVLRIGADMADSRGTLVDIKSLDRIWLPHFDRCHGPLLDAGIKLLWHCDGNLMELIPRLIECGVSGFQGFQYEDGMDYEKICKMTDRDGNPLMIWAGVSVTRTLPFGTPQQVRDELKFLVRYGPKVGLCLGGSSSITPGVRRENLQALFEGMNYYRDHGRLG